MIQPDKLTYWCGGTASYVRDWNSGFIAGFTEWDQFRLHDFGEKFCKKFVQICRPKILELPKLSAQFIRIFL